MSDDTKAMVAMGQHGVQPKTMEEAWRLCTAIAKSGLAPKSFDSPEKVFVAVQTGAERGWSPMQSLQYLYVVNGRVSIWGDAALAECRKSGLFVEDGFDEWFEVDGKRVDEIDGAMSDSKGFTPKARAVCQTLRKGAKHPLVRSFSVSDATRAGLWKKSGPWQNYPGRMLRYKARSFNLRDNFPDVLMGIHTVEELAGEVTVDVDSPRPPMITSGAVEPSAPDAEWTKIIENGQQGGGSANGEQAARDVTDGEPGQTEPDAASESPTPELEDDTDFGRDKGDDDLF